MRTVTRPTIVINNQQSQCCCAAANSRPAVLALLARSRCSRCSLVARCSLVDAAAAAHRRCCSTTVLMFINYIGSDTNYNKLVYSKLARFVRMLKGSPGPVNTPLVS